ncbi:hypothetical protein BDR07DRAFT_1489335 [Suillus spraguei]|nr:hypothetical protein BDR07DRAFT_1489335 [Suillus spraguei]
MSKSNVDCGNPNVLTNIWATAVASKQMFIGIVLRCRSLNLASLLTVHIIKDVYPYLTLEQHKRLFAGAVAITAICAQYTTLLMAQPEVNAPPQSKAPPTQWNDGKTAALVNYLYDHCSEAEVAGNFKQQVLSSAAEYINNLLRLYSKGKRSEGLWPQFIHCAPFRVMPLISEGRYMSEDLEVVA